MGLKAGGRQVHENCPDYFHPGRKVGKGVYITPLIKVAEQYAGISIIRGKIFKKLLFHGYPSNKGSSAYFYTLL